MFVTNAYTVVDPLKVMLRAADEAASPEAGIFISRSKLRGFLDRIKYYSVILILLYM